MRHIKATSVFSFKYSNLFIICASLILLFSFSTSNGIEHDGVILLSRSDVSTISGRQADIYRDKVFKNMPIVYEGAESELVEALGMPQVLQDSNDEYVAMATTKDGILVRGYFSLAKKYHEITPVALGASQVAPTDRSEIKMSTEEYETAKKILLDKAVAWAQKKSTTQFTLEAPAGNGDWGSSFGNPIELYKYGVDNNKIVSELTTNFYPHKIRDIHSQADWYLVRAIYQHTVNVEVNYEETVVVVGDGACGWYVQDRLLDIRRYSADANTDLLDYDPTSTINGGSKTISVGAGLSGSADGPGAGIDGSYSSTVNYYDVTVKDESSLNSDKARWVESFICPRGDYGGIPIVDWPSNPSKNSFKTEVLTIFKSSQPGDGISLNLLMQALVYKDYTTGYLFSMDVSRSYFDFQDSRLVFIQKNNAPAQPAKPSGQVEAWVYDAMVFSTEATDQDGDVLEYHFDWGDNSNTGYSTKSQQHQWVEGGNYGVRAKAKDTPYGVESNWSETFQIKIKAMTNVEIQGPESITLDQFAHYKCTATFNFNGGNVTQVNPTWSIISGANYAAISQSGRLTPNSNGGNQTVVIRATYADHGITKYDDKSIQLNFPTDVAAKENMLVPEKFALHQNYPNPFNPKSTINFDLPASGSVDIIVYNVLGNKIRHLVSGIYPAGKHSVVWDGKNDFGAQVPSDIYMYKMQADNYSAIKKMTLLR